MWLNKEHYYYVDRSYYNFSYAFGFLLSVGFYSMYEKNKPKFVKLYYKFLKNSGKLHVADLCSLMSINLYDSKFWFMSLEKVIKEIEEFENLALIDK